MSAPRLALLIAILVAIAAGTWFALAHRGGNVASGGTLAVYYTKVDGTTLGDINVSLRPQLPGESAAEHRQNVVLYAAVEAVAGPPSDVQAIRFPSGTRVLSATVAGSTATVDLSPDVERGVGGSFGENGEFKALVYTLTGLPNVNAVAVKVAGQTLETLPGGHLELDRPLHRTDW